jgi:hypothetical protein
MTAPACKFADKLITPLVLLAGAALAMGFLATSAAAAIAG